MTPTFSIIMPVYNHAEYVGEAIASIRAQQFQKWELIIVDDGSRDESGKIADAVALADKRIRVIHQANAGPSRARNRGLSEARGEWIAFLDSDDIWYPTTLSSYHAFARNHRKARFLYGFWDKFYGHQIRKAHPRHQESAKGFPHLFANVMFGSSCVCFQRSLLAETGDFNPDLPPVEDYDLFLRMSLRTVLHPIGQATGVRRRHGSNISANTGKNRLKEARLLESYAKNPAAAAKLTPFLISRRLGQTFYAAGREYFKAREYASASDALKISLSYRKSAKVLALRALCVALKTRPKKR